MRMLPILFLATLIATPAAAQVEVQPLAAPDYFSLGASDTGFSPDLWRGASPAVAEAVIGKIGQKPLSPAAQALGWRVLATPALGPGTVGQDPDVAAARIRALLALGRPKEAWAAAGRIQNAAGSAVLSEAIAETALIVGEDDRACRLADDLTAGRGEIYWLRLRAYCQARAGQGDAAQLTLTLAGEKARDATTARLVGAVIDGAGDPGAASLRNGLDFALTRRLALDVAAAKPGSPAIAAMLTAAAPQPEGGSPTLGQRFARPEGRAAEFDALFVQLSAADAKARPRYEGAALVALALGAEPNADQRAALAGFALSPGAVSPGRLAALDLAASAGLKGETALHVLSIASDAEGKPMRAADAARIVSALTRVGLAEDAVRFADEAFAALQVQ